MWEVADADQEGHPVYVFKQENLALRSAYPTYSTYHRKH